MDKQSNIIHIIDEIRITMSNLHSELDLLSMNDGDRRARSERCFSNIERKMDKVIDQLLDIYSALEKYQKDTDELIAEVTGRDVRERGEETKSHNKTVDIIDTNKEEEDHIFVGDEDTILV